MTFSSRKLSHQIIVLCLCLVLATTGSVLASFWWFSSRYTQDHIDATVTSAIHVFDQYSQTKAGLLKTAAQVLTADFGFKQAVATRDEATIASVLENHGNRIQADLMVITDREGAVISTNLPAQLIPSSDITQPLVKASGNPVFVAIKQRLFQVVALPVKAPRTIAFAIIGFEITPDVTRELKKLTDLEISFYSFDTLLVSSLTSNAQALEATLQLQQHRWGVWQRPIFANTRRNIEAGGTAGLSVLLSDNLIPIYDNFDRLVYTTILITSVVVALGLMASALLASSLTVPLARLVQSVNQFARGDYSAQIQAPRASSEIQALVTAFRNMGGEIREREKHILYQAQHDLLTGLMNRDTLLAMIDKATKSHRHFYLMATHLRDLKGINDNLGFEVGDSCIQEIVHRLQSYFKNINAVHGRLEGDIFLSLVVCEADRDLRSDLMPLLGELQTPVAIHSLNFNLLVNLGICRFPEGGNDGKTLIRRTLIALEAARKESVAIRFYQQGEDEAHLERLAIVEDLKSALQQDDGQLTMHYQPKQNLRNGHIEKLEALIRWQRPAAGFVPPDLFIELAERAGLIIELTQWVLNTVLAQLAQWHQRGIKIQVAINISAQDLNHPEFLSRLLATVTHYDVPSRYVTLELTERDLMSDEEQGIAIMNELRQKGFTLSVDDYGIGQSSLGKLKQLPVHELKIDKSFILKLDQSRTDQMIVRSTIELGHNLGFSVVAEGVENQASRELLRDMGCDYIQGYFLSKPQSADNITEWITEHERVLKQA